MPSVNIPGTGVMHPLLPPGDGWIPATSSKTQKGKLRQWGERLRKGGEPLALKYSNHSIFWEIILLIFVTQRICPEPEGVCLIHHACFPHNTRADKHNILK